MKINLVIGYLLIGIGIFLLVSGFLYLHSKFVRKIKPIRVLFHDLMGWHLPDKDAIIRFDGVNTHCVCEICKEKIMRDSQGNWF